MPFCLVKLGKYTDVPTVLEIRFVSSNEHKISEAAQIFSRHDIHIIGSSVKIEELQTTDTDKLVRDKVLKAFSQIGSRYSLNTRDCTWTTSEDCRGG